VELRGRIVVKNQGDVMNKILSLTLVFILMVSMTGCTASSMVQHKRSQSRTQISYFAEKQVSDTIILRPENQSISIEGVSIALTHMDDERLDTFFSNKKLFGLSWCSHQLC